MLKRGGDREFYFPQHHVTCKRTGSTQTLVEALEILDANIRMPAARTRR